jgi:hypothetical protein
LSKNITYIIVRQAERADFSKLMICQIFSTDVKKAGGGSELYTRLEIISDVVSEKARSGKIPIPHRKLFLTV